MSLSQDQEKNLWMEWTGNGQMDNDDRAFQLMTSFQPLIHSQVNKFRNSGLPPSVLGAEGQRLAFDALKSYNPNKGAALNTHIINNMRNIHRLVQQNQQVGKIPEARGMKMVTYKNVRSNLEDQISREPSVDEMADAMGWSLAETDRMEREIHGELTTGKIEGAEFYGEANTRANKDIETMRYLYKELFGNDKVIFEHTFGYGGKPILNNKDIAVKLHTNEMAITRAKRKLAQKAQTYR